MSNNYYIGTQWHATNAVPIAARTAQPRSSPIFVFPLGGARILDVLRQRRADRRRFRVIVADNQHVIDANQRTLVDDEPHIRAAPVRADRTGRRDGGQRVAAVLIHVQDRQAIAVQVVEHERRARLVRVVRLDADRGPDARVLPGQPNRAVQILGLLRGVDGQNGFDPGRPGAPQHLFAVASGDGSSWNMLGEYTSDPAEPHYWRLRLSYAAQGYTTSVDQLAPAVAEAVPVAVEVLLAPDLLPVHAAMEEPVLANGLQIGPVNFDGGPVSLLLASGEFLKSLEACQIVILH